MNQAAVSVLRRRRPDSLFLTAFRPSKTPGKPCCGLLFPDYDPDYKVPGKSRQYHAVSGSIRQTQITKNPRNIDFSSTFRGYFLVRGRGFEPLISPDSTLIFSKLLLNHYFALFLPNIYREAPCTSNPLPHEAADRFFSWS